MNLLKDQVCSLELSKRLYELNVKQDSLFYWEWLDDTCYSVKYVPFCVAPLNIEPFKHYSAFTILDLFGLLPIHISTQEKEPFNSYRLQITKSFIVKDKTITPSPITSIPITPITIINYRPDTLDPIEELIGKGLTDNIWDENPANALAKMLIYLIENNLMEL